MLEAELGGVIPRAIDQLFASLAKDVQSSSQGALQLQLSILFLEIYNECIRDLLKPTDGTSTLANSGNSFTFLFNFKCSIAIDVILFYSVDQSVELEFSICAIFAFDFLTTFRFLLRWSRSGLNFTFSYFCSIFM
jgi:hypothetical protein